MILARVTRNENVKKVAQKLSEAARLAGCREPRVSMRILGNGSTIEIRVGAGDASRPARLPPSERELDAARTSPHLSRWPGLRRYARNGSVRSGNGAT